MMTTNSKSKAGPYQSEQSNPQDGQFDIVKQELTSVQMMKAEQSSIAMNKSEQTSIAMNKVEQSSITINKSEQTSLHVDKVESSSIKVDKVETTSTKLLNKAKQVSIFSMDQFGHNQNKLRDSLSVLDAENVNTDKEYGVMQVEDDFEFVNIANADTIVKDLDGPTSYWRKNVMVSGRNNALTAIGSFSMTNGSADARIFPSQIINRIAGFIGNVFYLDKVAAGDGIYIGTDVVSESSSSNGYLNGSNQLSTVVDGFGIFSSTVNKFSVTIGKNSIAPSDILKMRIQSRYKLTDSLVSNDYTISATPLTVSSDWGSNDRAEFRILLSFDDGSTWIPVVYYTGTQSDFDGKDYKFQFNIDSFYQRAGIGAPYTNPLSLVSGFGTSTLFPFSMSVSLDDDTGIHLDKSLTFSQNDKEESTLVDVYEVANANNVFDYSSYDYFYGVSSNGLNSIQVTPIQMSISGNGYAIARIDDRAKLWAVQNGVVYSNPESYIKLIDVRDQVSIGLIERVDKTLCIGVKIDSNFYCAYSDSPKEKATFELSDIKIVENSNVNTAFVATVNRQNRYYTFKQLKYYNSGALLDDKAKNQYLFDSYPLLIQQSEVGFTSNVSGYKSVKISGISADSNTYINTLSASGLNLLADQVFNISSEKGLSDSYLIITDLIDYITKGLHFPIMYGLTYMSSSIESFDLYGSRIGKQFVTIASMPTLNELTSGTWVFASLPLRLQDLFPEIASGGEICSNSFILGKTRFASRGGNLYEAGAMSLVANKNKNYISESGRIFYSTGLVFLAKPTDDSEEYGLTNVYYFTELGLPLLLVIEDLIICNPVKIGVGIIACGRNGLWLIRESEVKKLWSSSLPITQASLKTDLDNSCIAILECGLFDYDLFYSGADGLVDPNVTDILCDGTVADNSQICSARPIFIAVTINQFGNVSYQRISTSINSINLIDIGPTAELLLLDLAGSNTINYLDKTSSNSTSATYRVKTNQNVELFQDIAINELISVKAFAYYIKPSGGSETGTITLYVNGVSAGSIEVIQGTRFVEYSFSVDSTSMQILDYELIVDTGVKILQRIIGIVIPREQHYV